MAAIKKRFYSNQIKTTAKLFATLGKPSNLAIIKVLSEDGPKTSEELVRKIGGLVQHTINNALQDLQRLNIIKATPHENTVVYSIWGDIWDGWKDSIHFYASGADAKMSIHQRLLKNE